MTVALNELVSTWDVNYQRESPLFSANFPAEIRLLIYHYVFADSDQPSIPFDFRVKNHHDGDHDDDGALEPDFCSDLIADETEPPSSVEYDWFDPENFPENEPNLDSSGEIEPTLSQDDEEPGPGQRDPTVGDRYGIYAPDPSVANWRTQETGDWTSRRYIRPGCTGCRKHDIALLRTCRRVYLEARLQLPSVYEYRIWALRGPPHRHLELFYGGLTIEQANCITSVEVNAQMFWLEGSFLRSCANEPYYFRCIKNLRLIIEKGDWWYNETNEPLYITPFGGKMAAMKTQMTETKHFGKKPPQETLEAKWQAPVDFGCDSWGLAFRWMPKLETLAIELETAEHQKCELEPIVEWAARTWRFPLGPKRKDNCTYLSAQGNPVEKMSWRGTSAQWPDRCPSCRSYWVYHQQDECPSCQRFNLLRRKKVGPRLYSWTVTWTPRVGRTWVPPVTDHHEEECGCKSYHAEPVVHDKC